MGDKERISFLRKELAEHNHSYYVLDTPVISDFEFDKLLAELQELEKANALALRDGDAKDEQLSGFGELFQELIFALRGFPEDGWSDWHSNAARGAVINLDLPKPEPPEGFKIKTG